MEAVESRQVVGTRRTGVVIALVLVALLASVAIGYFVRYATAPAATAAPAQHAAAIAPAGPVGDAWWKDAAPQLPALAPVGDQWWQDAPASAPGPAAVFERGDVRADRR